MKFLEICAILIFIGLILLGTRPKKKDNKDNPIHDIPNHDIPKDFLTQVADSLQGFTFTQRIEDTLNKRFIFGVDSSRKKVLVLTNDAKDIYKYEDIIGVELLQDDVTVASRSLGRMIGGAIIGSAIAGDVGGIVGGLSGSQKIKKEIKTIKVKIHIKDIRFPSNTIVCYDSSVLTDNQTMGMSLANKITDHLKVIINETERYAQKVQVSTPNVSVADELSKFAKLKEQGIITEEEFQAQKKRLLGV